MGLTTELWRFLGIPYKNIAKLMIWNLSGRAGGKVRQNAFCNVVDSTKPELIYYREAPSPFLKVLAGNYDRLGTRESGVIYDKNKLWCKDITYGSQYVSRLLEQLRVAYSIEIGREYVQKTRVALFAPKNSPHAQFALLLWHGKTDEPITRSDQIKELFIVSGYLSKLLLDLPVLICGNFAFDTLAFGTDFHARWTIHKYEPPGNVDVDRIMHTFVTLGDIQLTNIFHAQTVNTVRAEGYVMDGMVASHFDHEPVFANIIVNDPRYGKEGGEPVRPVYSY